MTEAEQLIIEAERWQISPERYRKIVEVARRRQTDLALVVENVHDPHNVSAIARSADSAGVATVHLLYTHEQFPRLTRATAMGSERWLQVRYWTAPERLFAELRSQGYRIYATALSPTARPLYSLDLSGPVALVVGNEHRGVSPQAQALADELIYIPMHGMAQSLNVSVATALVLFEAARQRLARGAYDRPELSPEQQELLNSWLERELHKRTRGKKRF